ncbi:Coat F domain-containing protein [Caldanaerobius fijiensis DSM 17918]|uniref:Coat F domain-containing protein n=1 Tax=Caldanaerobius fijiensis DSM 17918 TaxID=1121256 RepID=A0A1M4TTV0_9THEO|nr:spore coat protein [Caldanaerobius fijiensis]SHE47858.1 Coat F domain-containing protein [Caldanaerobius fijiensis DSM 17918]
MLSDKDIITDCVASQKWIESSYNYAASECADVNLKQDIMSILNDEHENQMIFWNTMNRKGWYKPYMVNPNDLRTAQAQFANVQSQIMGAGYQQPPQYAQPTGYTTVAQYGGQQSGTYGMPMTGSMPGASVEQVMRSNIQQTVNRLANISADTGAQGGPMAGYWTEMEGEYATGYKAGTTASQSNATYQGRSPMESSYQRAIQSGQALGAGQPGYMTSGKGSSYAQFSGNQPQQASAYQAQGGTAGQTGATGFTTNIERQMQNNIQNIVRNSI